MEVVVVEKWPFKLEVILIQYPSGLTGWYQCDIIKTSVQAYQKGTAVPASRDAIYIKIKQFNI